MTPRNRTRPVFIFKFFDELHQPATPTRESHPSCEQDTRLTGQVPSSRHTGQVLRWPFGFRSRPSPRCLSRNLAKEGKKNWGILAFSRTLAEVCLHRATYPRILPESLSRGNRRGALAAPQGFSSQAERQATTMLCTVDFVRPS